MTEFIDFVAHGWLRWMLAVSWQVPLVVLMVLGISRLLPNAISDAIRHRLWMLVALRLVVPPILPWFAPRSADVYRPVAAIDSMGASGSSFLTVGIFFAWLLGAIVLTGIMVSKTRQRGRALQNSAIEAPAAMQRQLQDTVKQMGVRNAPRLLLSKDNVGPLVVGLRRPTIILPSGAETWDNISLRHVLMHELTHVRCGDLVLENIFAALNALYWFHPAVYLARRRAHEAREIRCDALVSQMAGATYRDTLVRFAAHQHLGHDLHASAALVGGVGILARLRALEAPAPRRGHRSLAWLATISAVALTLALTAPSHRALSQPTHSDYTTIATKALHNEPGYGSLHARYAVLASSAKLP